MPWHDQIWKLPDKKRIQEMTAWLQESYKNINQTNDFRPRILENKKVFEKT